MKAILNIQYLFHETKEKISCIQGFNEQLIADILATIIGVVDFVQSEAQGRVVVRSHVNPDLDGLRERYHNLPDFLSNIVKRIADRVSSPIISTINVVYFPQLGFLVTIPLDNGREAEDIQEPGFELQFATEKVAYFKEESTRTLDEEIGDVYADMIDVEIEIVRVLVEQIAPHRQELLSYGQKLAELDCLLSFADFATENHLVKPIMTDGKDLDIKNGRYSS